MPYWRDLFALVAFHCYVVWQSEELSKLTVPYTAFLQRIHERMCDGEALQDGSEEVEEDV